MAEMRESNPRESVFEYSINTFGLFPLIQGLYDESAQTIGKQYLGPAPFIGANTEEAL
jgi:hypothetical protein